MTKIKESRKNKKITQKEMADRLKISLSYYQRIERYENQPVISIAFKISQILEEDIETLFYYWILNYKKL